MKKLYRILLIISLVINYSCTFSQDKDELLVEKEWVLYGQNDIIENDIKTDDLKRYFKKSDEVLVMKFQNNKTVKIVDRKEGKTRVFEWGWTSEDKESIYLSFGNNRTAFKLVELSNTDLRLGEYLEQPNHLRIEHYKHSSDKNWIDAKVDRKNLKAAMTHLPTLEVSSFMVLETRNKEEKQISICLSRKIYKQDGTEICMDFYFSFKTGKKWKTRVIFEKGRDWNSGNCIETSLFIKNTAWPSNSLDAEIMHRELKRGNIQHLQIGILGKNCKQMISTTNFSNI